MTLNQRGAVEVRKLLRLGERDVDIADLDANDVISLDVSGPAVSGSIILRLEDGLSLSGIRIVDGSVELLGENLRGLLLIVLAQNVGATLVNEDAAVTAANRLAVTPTAASVGVDQRQVFLLYNVSTSRWVIPNWSFFDPSNPASWDPVPATTAEALEQLADRAPLQGSGSQTWANDTKTVWSYSLSEREYYGGRFLISVAHDNAGTLASSIGSAEFVARRAVGGSAVVQTNTTPIENGSGTLASGTLAVTASGNDVIVTLLYPSLAGTAYYAWTFQPNFPVLP